MQRSSLNIDVLLYVFLRLTGSGIEQDILPDLWWALMFSTSSLLVDIMSSPLNCCHLAPDSVKAFKVRLQWLYYSPKLLSAAGALGLGLSPRISVFVQAKGRSVMKRELQARTELWGWLYLHSVIASHPVQCVVCKFIPLLISHLNKGTIQIIFCQHQCHLCSLPGDPVWELILEGIHFAC